MPDVFNHSEAQRIKAIATELHAKTAVILKSEGRLLVKRSYADAILLLDDCDKALTEFLTEKQWEAHSFTKLRGRIVKKEKPRSALGAG